MTDYSKIPKIENHIHLEGAIPHETLWQLIKKYGGAKEVGGIDQLNEMFKYSDFNHFIELWDWKNQFLREYEDFKLISDSVLKDLISQR
ncbi:MAG: adenosine deaminase, partial [Bacteroidales bacterium]|nr:adenosine deaminase [Bacteroidales bacterium]